MDRAAGFTPEHIRATAAKELGGILDKISSAGGGDTMKKAVLVDASLIDAIINTGLGTNLAPQKGFVVETVREGAATEDAVVDGSFGALVAFVRPSLRLMEPLARRIKAYAKDRPRMPLYIYFVPHRTVMAEHVLSEHGVSNAEKHGEQGALLAIMDKLELDLFALDSRLLSMEMPSVFRDLYLDGDLSSLKAMAQTLIKLQNAFTGPIPNAYAKGAMATRVLKLAQHAKGELDESTAPPAFDTLIIVDRSVDLITPFLSEVTYEGFIAEEFGLRATALRTDGADLKLTVPKPIRQPTKEPPPTLEGLVLLQSAYDEVFCKVRDYTMHHVGPELHRWTVDIREKLDSRHKFSRSTPSADGAAALQDLKEMREFVQNLPKWQEAQRLCGVHVDIATELNKRFHAPRFRKLTQMEQNILQGAEEKTVQEYVEELIDRGEPFIRVLRLLVLMSLCGGGIKAKLWDSLRVSLMHAYGIPQAIGAIYALERAGLLARSNASLLSGLSGPTAESKAQNAYPYTQLRKQCRIVAPFDSRTTPCDPGDAFYAYRGYAPVLVRAAEELLLRPDASGGVSAIAPGPRAQAQLDAEFATATGQRRTLVFVIGGATHAEVGAMCNVLSERSDTGADPCSRNYVAPVVVMTTSVLTGSDILQSLLPFSV
jgi:hypothetical protein